MAQPGVPDNRLELLKRLHSYETWVDRSPLPESLHILGFFLTSDDMPGWQRNRRELFESEQVRRTQSIWSRREHVDELLRVDLLECPSRTAAHELLLDTIGEFQSAAVSRQEVGLGDVAFGNGEFALVFARGNLVVMFRNAGRELVSVVDDARHLDEQLTSRPTAGHGVTPSIIRFELSVREAKVGEPVTIEMEAADPLGRPVWFKVFAAGGQLHAEGGGLIYEPNVSGSHRLTAFAVNENGGVATRTADVLAS